MNEEPLFFPSDGYRLFGVLHSPMGGPLGNSRVGLVFCDPFAEEKLWALRIYVNMARHLAENGIWALRFDCMGHGDSEGEFEASTVETRLRDIRNAVRFLKERSGADRIGLLGLRFGGTLAVIAGEADENVHFIIAWNPVVAVEEYLYDALRSNVTTQMATYGKVIRNRKQIIDDLLEGNPANIDGYGVSPDFYRQAVPFNLLNDHPAITKETAVVLIHGSGRSKVDPSLNRLAEKYADRPNVRFATVTDEPFWKEPIVYHQKSDELFRKTLESIRSGIRLE